MEVTFLENIELQDYDSVILVTPEAGETFVSDKIKQLFKTDVVPEISSDLSYGKIKSQKILHNGKFVELIIAGAGKRELLGRASLEKLGGYIYDHINSKNANVVLLNNIESPNNESAAAYLASGIELKSWHFDKYKSKKNETKIQSLYCRTSYQEINNRTFEHLETIKNGVFKVREMVIEPANVMDPDQVLEEASSLKKLGIKLTVVDKKQMEKLGMNALLGVAKGSDKPAYLIAMEYITDKSQDQIALVGKGLTFDSGGLCLKPSKGMADMKGDMTGAAVVIGTMKMLALQKASVNVVGLIGVVENMISGSAQKPGDVVEAMNGKTIEVDNTDAEGRLVLADVLCYAKEKYEPKVIIDFATLTGAIQVALGHEFAGLFSNSDDLSNKLEKSSEIVGEKIWRLPLHPSYESDINSDIADVKNVGCGRGAGSITAALFLKHFVDPETMWAHIDIAATEWDTKNRALSQKGPTGFGVRLMDEFIKSYYSKNGG